MILALDEPLAQDVAAALPEGKYDVRFAQSSSRGNFISGKVTRKEADAYEAQQMVEANDTHPGFLISDENTTSSLSGASLTAGAGRKGWHTVLRSGSNKSNLAIMADYYLAGEFTGERNVEQIVKFIESRVDEQGQIIPKSKLPQVLRWEMELDERQNKEEARKVEDKPDRKVRSEKIKSMTLKLVDEILKGEYPEFQTKLNDSRLGRAFITRAIDDIAMYIDNNDSTPVILTTEILASLNQSTRKLSDSEKLQKQFKDDPQAFHERAIDDVRRREERGDEPSGAADEFIAHVKREFPGFKLPHEQEDQAIWQKREELRREEKRARKGSGGRGEED